MLSVVTSSHLLELSAFPQALSLVKRGMINCPMLGLSALLQTLSLPLAQRVVSSSPLLEIDTFPQALWSQALSLVKSIVSSSPS